MRWLSIAASLALACAPLVGAGASFGAQQTSSSSTPSKHKKSSKKHHASHGVSQKAPTSDRISEIQSALARDGYYQGDPNGKWDANTIAAMEKFQSANGIEANGKLDAPTLQKLGLGSEIAGVSAPKQIVPPSANPAAPSNSPPPSTSAPVQPLSSAAPVMSSATTSANAAGPSSSDAKSSAH
jgi:peptidoglycan hydrolase-like protein with peptidoglycan-binding domain